MAKRKKKSSRRRRSSMGATGTGFGQIAGLLAGAVAGKFLSAKVLSNVDPKWTALGQVGVGMVLPSFVKNNFVKAMGAGMIVNGGMSALSSFGVLAGIGADDTTVEYIGEVDNLETISGDDDMMSGSADIQTIAGVDDEIGAFEDEMYS